MPTARYQEYLERHKQASTFLQAPGKEFGPVWPWDANRRIMEANDLWHSLVGHTDDGVLPRLNLYGDSPFRESTTFYAVPAERRRCLAVWDWVCRSGSSVWQEALPGRERVRLSEILPRLNANTYWAGTAWPTRAAGGCPAYTLDFRAHPALLRLAHDMAHTRMLTAPGNGFAVQYGWLTHLFLQAAAEVAVAKVYNLPFVPHSDFPLPYGIVVCPTLRCSFTGSEQPVLQLPCLKPDDDWLDRIVAGVCVALEIGPDPVMAIDRGRTTGDPANDRWAYTPVLAHVVGWETLLALAPAPVCRRERLGPRDWSTERNAALSIHNADLLPPASLTWLLAMANDAKVTPSDSARPLDKCQLQADEWTPELPCHLCSSINRETEGGIEKPAGGRPSLVRRSHEWKLFQASYRQAEMQIIRAWRKLEGKEYIARRRRLNTRWLAHLRTARQHGRNIGKENKRWNS